MLRIEAIADPIAKSPEKIYIEQETLRELYDALDRIGDREQAYLLYRYCFTDDVAHTMIGTAIHFNLSESRAKKLEKPLWITSGWSCRGGFSAYRCGGTGAYIYLCFLLRSVGFCFSKILHLCQHRCHKIRLPYCRREVSVSFIRPTSQMPQPAPFQRQPEAKVITH